MSTDRRISENVIAEDVATMLGDQGLDPHPWETVEAIGREVADRLAALFYSGELVYEVGPATGQPLKGHDAPAHEFEPTWCALCALQREQTQ